MSPVYQCPLRKIRSTGDISDKWHWIWNQHKSYLTQICHWYKIQDTRCTPHGKWQMSGDISHIPSDTRDTWHRDTWQTRWHMHSIWHLYTYVQHMTYIWHICTAYDTWYVVTHGTGYLQYLFLNDQQTNVDRQVCEVHTLCTSKVVSFFTYINRSRLFAKNIWANIYVHICAHICPSLNWNAKWKDWFCTYICKNIYTHILLIYFALLFAHIFYTNICIYVLRAFVHNIHLFCKPCEDIFWAHCKNILYIYPHKGETKIHLECTFQLFFIQFEFHFISQRTTLYLFL